MTPVYKPNGWDYFLIILNGYLAIELRGSWIGWLLAAVTIFLITIVVFTLLTGRIIADED